MAAGAISVARAQVPTDAGDTLRVRRIEARQLPDPDLRTSNPGRRTRDWYRISTEYQTAPGWMDDLSITYYILFQPDPRSAELRSPAPFVLLRGQSDYVNVKQGRHISEMYIHPNTMDRYGAIVRIGAVFRSQGRLLAAASDPSSRERWWEQLPPVDGLILPRHLTPYNPTSPDHYEAVQAAAPGAR